MDFGTVSYTAEDRVATIILNRPERFNALSYQVTREFFAVLDELESDLDSRVVIVTGAGRGFCSGFDLKAAAGGENGPWQEGLGPLQDQYRMQQVTYGHAGFIDNTYRLDTYSCLLYTSPSPRDRQRSRMPSSA